MTNTTFDFNCPNCGSSDLADFSEEMAPYLEDDDPHNTIWFKCNDCRQTFGREAIPEL